MRSPQISIVQSIDTEILRLLFIAHYISTGFYRDKSIPVIPTKDDSDVLSIYFPKLNYSQIPNFWEKVKKTEFDMTFEDNLDLIKETKTALSGSIKIDKVQTEKIVSKWETVEKDFWKILQTIFPDKAKLIGSINVNISQFGSRASYKVLNSTENQDLQLAMRDNSNVDRIAWGILSSIVSSEWGEIFYSWEEVMSHVDMLMLNTSLRDLFPDYKASLLTIHNTPPKYLEESYRYMNEIGMHFDKSFKLVGETIYLKDRSLNSELTKTQFQILYLLMNLEGKIVSPFEIGDVIWDNSDDFSLWAVNKSIQRLRNRLIYLGASPYCIKTLRGRGYVMEEGV